MNIAELKESALTVLSLLDEYSNASRREMLIDPVIYAYLSGQFGLMSRQHWMRLYGRPRPQRIDFRYGGSNPAVIEFAVRPPSGGSHLYGSQNLSELRKLTRVPQSRARRRYLLLLDRYRDPIQRSNLKASYDPLNAGRGRFRRTSVRVVYVHAVLQYDFLWRPERGGRPTSG
jgi:hypothetical protein